MSGRTIRCRLQQSGLSARRLVLRLPLMLPFNRIIVTTRGTHYPRVLRQTLELLPWQAHSPDLSPIENMRSMIAQRLTRSTLATCGSCLVCCRGQHGPIFQAQGCPGPNSFLFCWPGPTRWKNRLSFASPARPVGKTSSHLQDRPSPLEKSSLICRPGLHRASNQAQPRADLYHNV